MCLSSDSELDVEELLVSEVSEEPKVRCFASSELEHQELYKCVLVRNKYETYLLRSIYAILLRITNVTF